MTSEGTDCQGQLVWPVFIYLFLNKRQVVTLEKGTQTQSHMHLCTDSTHAHKHFFSTPPTLSLSILTHAHLVIIHLILKEHVISTFRKIETLSSKEIFIYSPTDMIGGAVGMGGLRVKTTAFKRGLVPRLKAGSKSLIIICNLNITHQLLQSA